MISGWTKLERETAALLLREALSAEPDYTEDGNARLTADRFARELRERERRMGLVNKMVPTGSVYSERQAVKTAG